MSSSSVFRTRCHTRFQPDRTCQHWSVDSLDAQPNRCHISQRSLSLVDRSTSHSSPICISSRSLLGLCRRLGPRRTLRTGLLFSAITLRSSIPALTLVVGRVARPDRSVGANAAADAARARMEDAVEQETFMVRSGKSTRNLLCPVGTSSLAWTCLFLAIFEVQCRVRKQEVWASPRTSLGRVPSSSVHFCSINRPLVDTQAHTRRVACG
jgi:hypothetical protein